LTSRQSTLLLVSVFVLAVCALTYELIVGTLSSYLLGNSVTQFSLTIGLFMSAMGLGSYASRWITRDSLTWFILIEVAVGLIGGASAGLLYSFFTFSNLYYPAMVVIIILIGSGVGMEIPLLTRLSGGQDALKNTLSNVLAFDYLGSLLASLVFPLILLPYLGLLKTSFATGLLNMAVAAMTLGLFRTRIPNWRPIGGFIGLISLLLLGGEIWALQLNSFFQQSLYDDPIIYTKRTQYQEIILTRWGDDLRLYLDGSLQFSAEDEYRYHEFLVHPPMLLSPSRESVLILGGGDGLAVREVLKYPDVQRIVLVDIDPEITRLAREHPALLTVNQRAMLDPRVELVHEDAFNYLQTGAERFPVILVDLPDPEHESLGKLYSQEFYKMIENRLAAGGMISVQSTSPYFARETYWCIAHTVTSAGFQTLPYHIYVPSFGDWGFVLASNRAIPTKTLTPPDTLRYLTPELWEASRIFDSDSSEIATEISTLDKQIILHYYEIGWKRWE